MLTNSGQSTPERIEIGIASFYIPDLLPKRQVMKLPADVLEIYTGHYQLGGSRTLIVTRCDGKLVLTAVQGGVNMHMGSLTPESKTRFFMEDDSRTTYIFSSDAQGHVQLVVEDEEGKPGLKVSRLIQANETLCMKAIGSSVENRPSRSCLR